MTKEARLFGLLLGSISLVLMFFINVFAGIMALSMTACIANLPEFYDTVVRKRESFLEHVWATYGWPLWGAYAWLRSKS